MADFARSALRAAVFGLVAFTSANAHAELLLAQTRQVSGQTCLQQGAPVDCATGVTVFGSGTMRVVLKDLEYTTRFASLSFALFSGSTLLQTLALPAAPSLELTATAIFDLASGGLYTARVYPVTQGPDFLGLYSLAIDFTPSAPPVPLPAAGWLLLSGLASLAGLARHRRWRSPG